VKALLFALFAAAQIETAPPPPEPPRPVHLPRAVQATLPNGLRIIVVEKHGVPLVAARLLIATGSEADPPRLPGLAAMTATLLSKGTAARSAEQIARDVEVLGATLDTGAGWDNSFLAVDVMSSRFPKALANMADVMLHPAFAQAEVEREGQKQIDQLRVTLTDPGRLAIRAEAPVLYGDEPYGHSGLTAASAAAMRREDLVAFHERYYTPGNAILVLAGDITPAEATKLAAENFGSWTAGAAAAPASEHATLPKPRVVVVDLPDAGQAMVVVARPGLARNDPEYAVAEVTNAVLGGGISGRLSKEIRIKRGLSYGANSWFDYRRDRGPFTAYARTKNESAAEVARLAVAEVNRVATEPVPAEELSARKAALIGNFGRSLETNAGLARLVAELALYRINLDEIDRYIPTIDAVTSAQVQQFSTEHLSGPSSIIIAGDAKKLLDAVKKEFPDVEVMPAADVK
jgi:zinc protease